MKKSEKDGKRENVCVRICRGEGVCGNRIKKKGG
jgi:hypothetical protein